MVTTVAEKFSGPDPAFDTIVHGFTRDGTNGDPGQRDNLIHQFVPPNLAIFL